MMGRMRRGIGLLLVCCMLLTLVPMAAFAAREVDEDWEPGDFGYDLLVENLFSRLDSVYTSQARQRSQRTIAAKLTAPRKDDRVFA
jgi:hypothetical protein